MKSTSKWFKLEEIVAEEAEEEVEEAAEEGDAAGDFKSKRSTLENNGQQGNQLDENYRTPKR